MGWDRGTQDRRLAEDPAASPTPPGQLDSSTNGADPTDLEVQLPNFRICALDIFNIFNLNFAGKV